MIIDVSQNTFLVYTPIAKWGSAATHIIDRFRDSFAHIQVKSQ